MKLVKFVALALLLMPTIFAACNNAGDDDSGEAVNCSAFTEADSCGDEDACVWINAANLRAFVPQADNGLCVTTAEAIQLIGCEDEDGDGHDGFDADYCATGDDYCDGDLNNWTENGCTECADADSDFQYFGCDSYVDFAGPDCNDNDRYENPANSETAYNGKDDDCNPDTPDDDLDGDGYDKDDECDDTDGTIWQQVTFYPDNDNDGYGFGAVETECLGDTLPAGFSENADDCNDSLFSINPGLPETPYNDIDDDCNPDTPDDDLDNDGHLNADDCDDSDQTTWQIFNAYLDADDDGFGGGDLVELCSGVAMPDGYTVQGGDCDDTDSASWQLVGSYLDVDGDGYGSGNLTDLCIGTALPENYTLQGGDCIDTDDAHWFDCGVCADIDGDDHGTDCDLGEDCNESDYEVFYGQVEIVNLKDDDCDGIIDESAEFDELFLPPTAAEIAAVRPDIVRTATVTSPCVIGEIIEENSVDLSQFGLGENNSFTYRVSHLQYTSDNKIIQGVIVEPVSIYLLNYPYVFSSKKFPTIVYNHPTGDITPTEISAMSLMVISGILYKGNINIINPSLYTIIASAWRGWSVIDEDHRSEGIKDFYAEEVTDQVNLIECARRLSTSTDHHHLDMTNFMTFGVSYGGGMSVHTALQTPNNMKCAVDIVGPTNLFDIYFKKAAFEVLNGAEPPIDNPVYDLILIPWGDGLMSTEMARREMILRSPLYFADMIDDPIDIHHGNADELVPYQNSVDLHERLDELGSTNTFHTYNGADHTTAATLATTAAAGYVYDCLYPE